jgi:predicted enzyme related to lactoylglutathione lyase
METPMSAPPAATLNWVNLFVRNLDDLPGFYSRVFGFPEIAHMRNAVFCGLDAGGSALGFMAPEVYSVLQLDEYSTPSGAGFLLNFEAGSQERVDELVAVAIAAGAQCVKAPYTTGYGWYQAVLLDPEQNVFRINHILCPAP